MQFHIVFIYLNMILVTGGTGLVGAHLLCRLVQEESKVRAIYREKNSVEKTKNLFRNKQLDAFWDRIEWLEADITQLPQLTRAFEGITQVYHCAAMVSFQIKDFDRMSKINIEGTAAMVNLALAFGIEKFCHVSSIATLDEINKKTSLFDENSTWNPHKRHSDYAITKNGAEMEVWRAIQEGLPAVIVNPGVILGDGFPQQGSGLIRHQIEKGMPFYTQGIMPIIAVEDVVEAMFFLMKNNHFNQRFVLVAENRSIQEVFFSFAKKLNKKPPHISISKKLMHIAAIVDAVITAIIPHKKRSITPDLVHTSFSQNRYDSSKYLQLSQATFLSLNQLLHLE